MVGHSHNNSNQWRVSDVASRMGKTVQDFRSNPLSDKIICAMISAIQAYTEMDVLVNEYPENKPLLSNMMLSLDVFYRRYNDQPDIESICHALFISNKTSMISKTIEIATSCAEYAKNKVALTEVLTAVDILRVNSAIITSSTEPLLSEKLSNEYEKLVEPIWMILHDLYSPNRQYPLLLEAAIACFRLLTLFEMNTFSQQTMTILLSTVYENEFAFCGLLRQWVLSIDPRGHFSLVDITNALVSIIGVFQKMWAFTAMIMHIINGKRTEIADLIKSIFPQQISIGISSILSESMCIRKRETEDRLNLSSKTVTKLLTQLEQRNILHSVKNWRETLYFNNLMIDILRKQL